MLRSIPPSIYGVCIHSQSLRRCRCTYFICQFKRLDAFFFTVFFCHLSIAPYKNVFYHFPAISDCTFIVPLQIDRTSQRKKALPISKAFSKYLIPGNDLLSLSLIHISEPT